MMINKFLTDIKIIKSAIATKKLVIFAGAGISIDAGVPSWSNLVDELKSELDLPSIETDFLKIPQIYYNERQEKEYIEKIRNVLKHKKLKHNEIHEEIFELDPEHVLTTNFEDLLDQVIVKKSLPFSIIKRDVDLPYSDNTKLLVKIHGDLDSANFVLKEDDYINYSKDHPLIEAFVHSIFATKVVLFVGYSFNDYNLKLIVQNVRNILGNNFQSAYLISIDDKIHNSQKQYLKNKGINVLNYFDVDSTDENGVKKNFIENFLQGENIYKKTYSEKVNSLSGKGLLLLNFLKFIRYYDELKIEPLEINVIDQITKSFNRFSEIKSLPQDFICKLYPFKSSLKYEHLLQGTTLLLKNSVVKKLFMEDITIEKDIIKYNPKEKLVPKNITDFEEKIREIVIKLNNSLIFSVSPQNEKSDSFGYRSFSPNSKNITLKGDNKCKCSKCTFENFQFDIALVEINIYAINEISDLKEDLQKAFLNYKFGNFLTAYNMYEEIASKAWQTGKYITYYIAKRNRKSLKWTVKSEEIAKKLDDKLFDNVDTDKLIFQIPYKSNEEYELLKIIRDDTILQNSKNNIDNLHRKISKVFEGYNGSYYTEIGPYYPQLVYIELYKTIQFYNDNYIIGDIYENFKSVIAKGLEALIISHITSETYTGKLKELSSDIFYLTICYFNSDAFYEFIDRHNITKLKFEEEAIAEIIDYCINYFNSFFKNSQFAYNNSLKNSLIFNQLSIDFFKNEMQSHFKKIMLFLPFVEIPAEKQRDFIESLIIYLEYENFLFGQDIKYLNLFLEKNFNLFSKSDCTKILKFIHNKVQKYESELIIKTIGFIANENQYDLLEDKDYTLKILCISVFNHTAVMLAITSLSNNFSPKYLLFSLYTNSSR